MIIRINNFTIQDIIAGTKFLIDKGVHSPDVRQFALEIVNNKEPITAVYDWVKANMSYVSDPKTSTTEIELFISPVVLINDFLNGKSIGGDCDDMGILTTTLYNCIGLRSNLVIIDSNGSGYDHAYSRVWSDKLNDWLNVDPSSKFPVGWVYNFKSCIIVE
jgi:transglutaminase-like putative cysteine protease